LSLFAPTKKKIDDLRIKLEEAERKGNFEEVAKIKFGAEVRLLS
jgi:hypothetical protein